MFKPEAVFMILVFATLVVLSMILVTRIDGL